MKHTILLFIGAIFAAVTACQNPTAAPSKTDSAPLIAARDASHLVDAPTPLLIMLINKSADDWNKGDLKAFMDFYDDSATMMGGHGLINKDTMSVHYANTYFKNGAPKQQLSFDEFQVTPLGSDYALFTGRFTLRGGNLPTLSGHFSLVCVHRQSGWKILHDHTS